MSEKISKVLVTLVNVSSFSLSQQKSLFFLFFPPFSLSFLCGNFACRGKKERLAIAGDRWRLGMSVKMSVPMRLRYEGCRDAGGPERSPVASDGEWRSPARAGARFPLFVVLSLLHPKLEREREIPPLL